MINASASDGFFFPIVVVSSVCVDIVERYTMSVDHIVRRYL
jgi:hypothetical protein